MQFMRTPSTPVTGRSPVRTQWSVTLAGIMNKVEKSFMQMKTEPIMFILIPEEIRVFLIPQLLGWSVHFQHIFRTKHAAGLRRECLRQ